MARIEKTVFISYRRKDISWALAVYQYLTSQKYDVFFDYTSIPSGDFEQIIVSNIKARAHFVLILTPTALDRCSQPGDWLRREIETAMVEKRNIIPLFFDGFSFGAPAVAEKLTGKLADISRYNGLDIPSGYFMEGMERLRNRYLNIPLNAVIHPVPTEVRKVVKEEKSAADKALREQKEEIKELVKPVQEKPEKPKQPPIKKVTDSPLPFGRGVRGVGPKPNFRPYALGVGILLLAVLGLLGMRSLMNSSSANQTPEPTQTGAPTKPIPTSTVTVSPSVTPTPTLGVGSTTTGEDGMTMIYIPAGEFTMGSENGEDDEKPVHTVYLDSFWIDETEITNVMYKLCVQDGKCSRPADTGGSYYFDSEYDNSPVIYVSWYDAHAYCSWANRRLPTEAEWEKAARGGLDSLMYPWGNELPVCDLGAKNGAHDGCEIGPMPVGSFMANGYGIYDMAGNVEEWVNDWYDRNYYAITLLNNPLGPNSGEERVARGGAWSSDDITVANRERIRPAGTNGDLGFRCAMDASE